MTFSSYYGWRNRYVNTSASICVLPSAGTASSPNAIATHPLQVRSVSASACVKCRFIVSKRYFAYIN